MIILADTREQHPLDFKLDEIITEVRRTALDVGDYGCQYTDGWCPPFYFERKSLGDLYGTMTHGYKRFKRELARAKESRVKLFLIVESSLEEVKSGYKHSEFQGESMLQKLFTLRIRYDLETIFCNSRGEMIDTIRHFYMAIGREKFVKEKS